MQHFHTFCSECHDDYQLQIDNLLPRILLNLENILEYFTKEVKLHENEADVKFASVKFGFCNKCALKHCKDLLESINILQKTISDYSYMIYDESNLLVVKRSQEFMIEDFIEFSKFYSFVEPNSLIYPLNFKNFEILYQIDFIKNKYKFNK